MIETTDKPTLSSAFAPSENRGELIIPPTSQLGLSGGGGFNQIITAQPTPVKRDLQRFMRTMEVLSQAAGEDYYYSWEVKDKNGKKSIVEGGSIKLANDLAREYGNCIVDTFVEDKPNAWVIYAKFIDLETGFSMVRPFMQRKSQSSMKTDSDRQLDIAFQIGASKAIRNIVLNSLQSFAEEYKNQAKKSLINRIKANPEFYREGIVRGCKDNNWPIKIVEFNIGKVAADWKPEDMAKIMATLKSVKDGMATFDEVYPDPESAPKSAEDLTNTYTTRKTKTSSKKKEEEAEQSEEEKLKEYEAAVKEAEAKANASKPTGNGTPPSQVIEAPSDDDNNTHSEEKVATPKPEPVKQTEGGAAVGQGGSASPKKETMPVELAIPRDQSNNPDYEVYVEKIYNDIQDKSEVYLSWFIRINSKGLNALRKDRPDLFEDLNSKLVLK